jgi:hypothetical protein
MISLLDARGGSPPTAEQILVRSQPARCPEVLPSYFLQWEAWSAEVLERCLSFPVLGLYRSQHDNQSWLAALTVILDTSALAICGAGGRDAYQARLTFAMARRSVPGLQDPTERADAKPSSVRGLSGSVQSTQAGWGRVG